MLLLGFKETVTNLIEASIKENVKVENITIELGVVTSELERYLL